MNREQFERLERIAEILSKNGGGYYKELTNNYHHCNIYFDKYLNGAWHAWQEQQKKADKVIYAIAQSELHGDRAIWGLQDEIKELLK